VLTVAVLITIAIFLPEANPLALTVLSGLLNDHFGSVIRCSAFDTAKAIQSSGLPASVSFPLFP
jgi:hypothetical protein